MGTVIKDTHNFMLFPNSLQWSLKTAPKKSYRQKTLKIVENSKNFKFSTLPTYSFLRIICLKHFSTDSDNNEKFLLSSSRDADRTELLVDQIVDTLQERVKNCLDFVSLFQIILPSVASQGMISKCKQVADLDWDLTHRRIRNSCGILLEKKFSKPYIIAQKL